MNRYATAHTIAENIQARTGWDDSVLLDLVLTYVDRQGDNGALIDYLEDEVSR